MGGGAEAKGGGTGSKRGAGQSRACKRRGEGVTKRGVNYVCVDLLIVIAFCGQKMQREVVGEEGGRREGAESKCHGEKGAK